MKILRIAALALFVAASLSAERLALLDNGLRLLFIDSSAPSVTLATVTVTGMQAGETLAAIDYRPSNGVLYGIGALVASGPARLYTINTTTGAATLVGSGPFHQTIGFFPIGMDFNPVVDRIRMISNGGHNLRVNPNDASVIEDARPAFAPGDPHSSNFTLSLAYSNNFAGATSTTLYGIVSGNGPFLAT
ncbi:MAG TPA: DUF4394 domain-containing protein, partial [Thermoanaerobaculia bacterium]|nr:DUF4394 domain-containing protein [Thermoanaerobaculia bacterium]